MSLNNKLIQFIQCYQRKKTSNGKCRHYPCCSDYGLACYRKFGFLKATILTGCRILRCNPLSKKVYDPVPLSKKEKVEKENRMHKVMEIKDILLKHHQKYPKMHLQDDLVLIIENSLPRNGSFVLPENTTFETEDIGFDRFRLYINDAQTTQLYDINQINDFELFLDKIEIWQNLIFKKMIHYSSSKKKISDEISSYLIGKKKICHSEIYIKNYPINYYVVTKKDIQ